MFRLLLRLIVPVIVVCAALTALAPLIFQRDIRTVPSWRLFGFEACALPCWGGITVGTTPFVNALSSMQSTVPMISDYAISGAQVYVWGDQLPYFFSASAYYGQGDVGSIRLNVIVPPDHLITRLGMPDCVFTDGQAHAQVSVNVMYWIRDDVSIGAWIRGEIDALFDSSEAVYTLWMASDEVTACEQNGTTRWRGVAPWWRYEQWENEVPN